MSPFITEADHVGTLTLLPRLRQVSEQAKLIRFGLVQNANISPWSRLVGMFSVGQPVNIEEMLDARGFEESAGDL